MNSIFLHLKGAIALPKLLVGKKMPGPPNFAAFLGS